MPRYIYIYGPDGSGKTAVALGLKERLQPTILVAFEPYNKNPFDSGNRGRNSASEVKQISMLKSVLLFVRYVIRDLLFKIYNFLCKNKHTVIYTRGVLEFGTNNTHSGFPVKISVLYQQLFQKNSILLVRDVFKIHEQKDELNIDDLFRIYDKYMELELVPISNNGSINSTCEELCERLL